MTDVSICIPHWNQHALLENTLESIYRQEPSCSFEVIVCDHGSDGGLRDIQERFGNIKAVHRARVDGHINAGLARNPTYRAASGKVILINSADVRHATPDTIERMAEPARKAFDVATVFGLDKGGKRVVQYTGKGYPPLCALMAVRKEDIYAIGGDDEDFIYPAFDDYWLADRLMHGLGLRPTFRDDVIGEHQWHSKDFQRQEINFEPAKKLYEAKLARAEKTGDWTAPGGAWL